MGRQIGGKIDQHPGVGRQSVQIIASVQVSNTLERRPWHLNMSPNRLTELLNWLTVWLTIWVEYNLS